MEMGGYSDKSASCPHMPPGSACVLVRHELWVIPCTLSSFPHLFKDTAANKFRMEFIRWYLPFGLLTARSKMGISARDLLGECFQEGEQLGTKCKVRL